MVCLTRGSGSQQTNCECGQRPIVLSVEPHLATENEQIIEWLSPVDFTSRHKAISKDRQDGTGMWLLKDPCFQGWESGSGKTLWCLGVPGAGKTVLVSKVVDHLKAEYKNTKTGVAFIYVDHKEAQNQSPEIVLSGLWRQLIHPIDIGHLAKDLYRQFLEEQIDPLRDEVFAVLCQAITRFSKVYIVVDAMDEYPERQKEILLEYLARMGPTVNLMITSRTHVIPDSSLPNLDTMKICANEDDIRSYVEAQIKESPRLKRHIQDDPKLREEIHSNITGTGDGIFLLARLRIESFNAEHTVHGVREAFKALPKTLDDSYDYVMKRIEDQDEKDKNLAYSALTWVLNAQRPLKVLELQTALAIKPGSKSVNMHNIVAVDIILSVCVGLLIVDEEEAVVRL
ncbi:hypothetical protein B0H19DRAFT_923286, partial [Mycena capillaripes]